MNRENCIRLMFVSLATVIAAFFCAGKLGHKEISRATASTISTGIHTDGWVEDGSELLLTGLARRSNYLEIYFEPWRPPGQSVAKLRVEVCDKLAATHTITTTNPIRLSLRGDCQPRKVTFRFDNPFRPAGDDSRALGAKFVTMQVRSDLGVPLKSLPIYLDVFLALLVVTLSLFIALRRTQRGVLASLLFLGVACTLVFGTTVSSEKIFFLWLFTAPLVGGAALSSFYRNDPPLVHNDLSQRIARVSLALVMFIGFLLRASGLSFGLPANFHPDEVAKVDAVMQMAANGNLHPHHFYHPSLLLYCTYGVTKMLLTLGVDGTFRDNAFLAGRIVSLTAGTISLPIVFAIGALLFNRVVALSSAFLLAVFPLHVTCSRYLKEDSMLTFWILMTVLLVILAVRKNHPVILLLAGLASGITAGSKYSGFLVGVLAFAAPWIVSRRLQPDRRFLPWTFASIFFIPLGFLITTPYAVLDYQSFLTDFRYEALHMQSGHTAAIDPWSQLWMYHFSRSVMPGMGSITALLGVFSIGFLLWHRRIEGLLVVALVALYYLPAEFVKAKPAPQPERYIVPCLPFLALSIGIALNKIFSRVSPVLVVGIAGCIGIMPLLKSMHLASELSYDTRLQMADWIRAHVPPGSTILMDWRPYSPHLDNDNYKIVYLPRERMLKELSLKRLRQSQGNYLLISSLSYDRYFSQPQMSPAIRQIIREVFKRVPVEHQIAPRYGTYGFHNPLLTIFSLNPSRFAALDAENELQRLGKLDATSNEIRARILGSQL